MDDVTHLVFAALYEKPGLFAGWRERDQMETNLAMLANLFEPLERAATGLRHVSILQGTKAYGAHLKPIEVPARESRPRDNHENFYWLQEDHLRASAARHGFAFTIFRPQLVFGDAPVAMNLMPVIGAYAAIAAHSTALRLSGGPSPDGGDRRAPARTRAGLGRRRADRPRRNLQCHQWRRLIWRNVWPALPMRWTALAPDAPRSIKRSHAGAGRSMVHDRAAPRPARNRAWRAARRVAPLCGFCLAIVRAKHCRW
jgi:hypothetical protein